MMSKERVEAFMKSRPVRVPLLFLAPLFLVMLHPVAGLVLAAAMIVILLLPGVRERVL